MPIRKRWSGTSDRMHTGHARAHASAHRRAQAPRYFEAHDVFSSGIRDALIPQLEAMLASMVGGTNEAKLVLVMCLGEDALQKPDHEVAKAHARLIKRLGARIIICAQLLVRWSMPHRVILCLLPLRTCRPVYPLALLHAHLDHDTAAVLSATRDVHATGPAHQLDERTADRAFQGARPAGRVGLHTGHAPHRALYCTSVQASIHPSIPSVHESGVIALGSPRVPFVESLARASRAHTVRPSGLYAAASNATSRSGHRAARLRSVARTTAPPWDRRAPTDSADPLTPREGARARVP